MPSMSLPFSLVSADENTPVTTASEIYDTALGESQASLNQRIGQGGGGGASMNEIQSALDTLKVALQGNDATATLTAIKTLVAAIPTATYSEALNALQTAVEGIASSQLTATDKTDIINAINAAAPTIDFTQVLNAISASQSAVIAAMPSTSGLALESTAQAAKDAAEGIIIPTDYAKVSDIPTDYAKQGADASVNITQISQELGNLSASQYKGVLPHDASTDNVALPNAWNQWGTISSAVTITKGAEIAGVVNEYVIRLACADGASVTLSGWTDLSWNGGSAPSWTSGKVYEISIVGNIAVFVEV